MADLFAWGAITPIKPATALPAKPPARMPPPQPAKLPTSLPPPPAHVRETHAGTADHLVWPRTMRTAEHPADPAFCALLDAIGPWTIGVPYNGSLAHAFAGAEHVLHLLSALLDRGLLGPSPSADQATPVPAQDLAALIDQAVRQSGGRGSYTYAVARNPAAVLRALPDDELWLDGPGDTRRSMGESHALAHALQQLGKDSVRAWQRRPAFPPAADRRPGRAAARPIGDLVLQATCRA